MIPAQKLRIVGQLCPPLDSYLASQLIEEFMSCERRYIQRDWEPAELDGGQFAEIAARIWYHQDSGNLNLSKELKNCVEYIENDQVKHLVLPRQVALHIARVLRTIYKFRSQRGAVHISPTYSPNHMDAKFIVESVRWVMNETLRVFWNNDREEVAKLIRELLQFEVPAIGRFGEVILVQRVDLTVEEEILVLLHYAGDDGFSRAQLGKYCGGSAPSVTKAIQKLVSPAMRQIVEISAKQFRLTDLGSKRVREELPAKLQIQ